MSSNIASESRMHVNTSIAPVRLAINPLTYCNEDILRHAIQHKTGAALISTLICRDQWLFLRVEHWVALTLRADSSLDKFALVLETFKVRI